MALSRAIAVVAASAVLGAHGQALLGLAAGVFSVYPGYTGNTSVSGWQVSGNIGIAQTADSQIVMKYDLKGADPNCTNNSYATANVCGIHIHTGTACNADAGAHFYTVAADPWSYVSYKGDNLGNVTKDNVVVKAGTTLAQNVGKTLILHDSNGTRMACAVLSQISTSIAPAYAYVSKHTLYSGSLTVTGLATMYQAADPKNRFTYVTYLSFSLQGVDRLCTPTTTRSDSKSCRIFVNVGNCSSAASAYFNHSLGDPWAGDVYYSDANGTTGPSMSVAIDTNVTVASMIDRSVVVYDFSGVLIGCGAIGSTLPTTTTRTTTTATTAKQNTALIAGTSGTTIGSALAAAFALIAGRSY